MTKATMNAKRMRDAMRALGDPCRWDIVQLLATHGEIGLGQVAELFPVGKSTISYHVRTLREAGIVSIRKQGRHRYAELNHRELDAVVRSITALSSYL